MACYRTTVLLALLALLLLAQGCSSAAPGAGRREASALAAPPAPAASATPADPAPPPESPAEVNRGDPASVHAAWVAALRAGDLDVARGLFLYQGTDVPDILVEQMGQLMRGEAVGGARFGALQGVELLGEQDLGEVVLATSEWHFEVGVACYSALISRVAPGDGWGVQHWQQAPQDTCAYAREQAAAAPTPEPSPAAAAPLPTFVPIPGLDGPAFVNRDDPVAVNMAWVAALRDGDLETVTALYDGGPYLDPELKSPEGLVGSMGQMVDGGDYLGQDLGAFLGAEAIGVYRVAGLDVLAGLSLWRFEAGSFCFTAFINGGAGEPYTVYDWLQSGDQVCAEAVALRDGS